MQKLRWIIILLNCVVLLFFFNRSVLSKESLLKDGKLILLELAPVDPRSLMQGDYMQLRYAITQGINADSVIPRGFVVVKLRPNGVADRIRIQPNKSPLIAGEYAIRYTAGPWSLNLGAESFFFQEGDADKYAMAKYGGLKSDEKGETVLIGLFDEHLKQIH
ncbi:GDYXXLXY domain-containing protein [Flavitalea sp.]|nr:GDYXXLXY domain-containing protein [Flavitalea sp.]